MQDGATMGDFSVLSCNQHRLAEERNWIIHITVQTKLIADLWQNDSNYN